MTTPNTGLFYLDQDREFFEYYIRDAATTTYNSIDDLVSSGHSRKHVLLHFPYPYNTSVEQILNQWIGAKELQFIIVITELHYDACSFIKKYDQDSVIYFINGQLNFDLNYSKQYTFLDWFETTKQYYELNQYSADYLDKPYKFDALLGRNKPHRLRAYDYITANLSDQVFLKFNEDRKNYNFSSSIAWDTGVDNITINPAAKYTVETVEYKNKNPRLSQIIPEKIYNQTYYSLVAETHFLNDVVFLTEKIVKPIIGKRLFILLGNPCSLKFLKTLGFKTFDTVIDESYDAILDPQARIDTALVQVEYLCAQDPITVIEKIQPIVEHNHHLLMTVNWQSSLPKFLSDE